MALLFEQETYKILRAAFEVYNQMGNGYVEAVYQECMEKELVLQEVPFTRQQRFIIHYKNEPLN